MREHPARFNLKLVRIQKLGFGPSNKLPPQEQRPCLMDVLCFEQDVERALNQSAHMGKRAGLDQLHRPLISLITEQNR